MMKFIGAFALVWLFSLGSFADTLSSSDRIAVTVTHGEEFSSPADAGFLIGADGMVVVPRLGKVPAAGREENQVEQDLTERLRYYIKVPQVSVSLVSVSPVAVEVTGAVYRPGKVVLTAEAPSSGATKIEASAFRTVFNALKKAGGIRPEANVTAIEVERAGQRRTLGVGEDASLITGDRIFVPSGGNAGINPSQLAPDQITVYVSGVDLPNSTIGAVALKPGATLFRALTAAGATGQNFLRGGRQVVLIRLGLDQQRQIQRFALDEVVSGQTDPLLEEGDSIAVDGGSVSTAKGFIDFISPFFYPLTRLFIP
jgi:polysaccharide export outer membrane protein